MFVLHCWPCTIRRLAALMLLFFPLMPGKDLQAQLLFLQDSSALVFQGVVEVYVEGGLRLGGNGVDGRVSGSGTLVLGANSPPVWGSNDWVNENVADSGWLSGSKGRLVLAAGRQRMLGVHATRVGSMVFDFGSDTVALGAAVCVEDTLRLSGGSRLLLMGHGMTLRNTDPAALVAPAAAGLEAETHPLRDSVVAAGYGVVSWRSRAGGPYTVPFAAGPDLVPVQYWVASGLSGYVSWSTYATADDNLPWPIPGALWSDSVTDLYSSHSGGDHAAMTANRYWLLDLGGLPGIRARMHWGPGELDPGLLGWEDDLQAQSHDGTAWIVPGLGTSLYPGLLAVDGILSASGPYALAPAAVPLPVGCLDFTANTSPEGVILRWRTASEIKNRGFRVERLRDGESGWIALGFVDGSGNSTASHDYSFLDHNPVRKGAYYRLVQIDLDGSEHTVCSLVFAEPAKGVSLWDVGPNPMVYGLRISSPPQEHEMPWQLLDSWGRSVLSGVVPAQTTSWELDASLLPAGVYTLLLRSLAEGAQVFSLVKL